jgi:hypothetical protein
MEDPRTIFYLPADKQVIVYFEWEGPAGNHSFEGYWKNPEGKVSVISDFKFEAREKRFGAYWTLTLNETMETGLWTLEAHVDGEVTGTHTFQVLAGTQPADAVPAPRALVSAEIYKRAGDASVFIDRLDAHGQRAGRGMGFFLGENIVATAFQVIDGASALRVTLPNGQTAEGNFILAWNRRQDWAVLEVLAASTPPLERVKSNAEAVGDRVFLLDSPSEGSRTLAETELVGAQEYPAAGRRLAISYAPSAAAIGGPLLNEYGQVIGVVGGSMLPGASTLQALRFGYSASLLKITGVLGGVLGVPIDLVSLAPPRRIALAEMARGGQFTPLLSQHEEVMSGLMCRQIDHKSAFGRAVGEGVEFRRRDTEIYVQVTWEPKSKRKGQGVLEVYDLENRAIFRSAPGKMNLEQGKILTTEWKLALNSLAPGIYRVDVLLDGEAAWRTFIKITD